MVALFLPLLFQFALMDLFGSANTSHSKQKLKERKHMHDSNTRSSEQMQSEKGLKQSEKEGMELLRIFCSRQFDIEK